MPPLRKNYKKKPSNYCPKGVKKYVKKAIQSNSETKYTDYDITTAAQVTNGGINYYISDIAGGTNFNQRVGLSVRVHRLEIRGQFSLTDAVNQSVPQAIRMVLYRDNNEGPQNSTVLPDLLETGNAPTIQQYDFDSIDKRFKVLYDKRAVLDALHGPRIRTFYFNVKTPMLMKWNSAVASAPGKGRLVLAFVSDEATGSEAPQLQFTSRMWYTDS